MSLIIHGVPLSKDKLQQLIAKNKKIQAIHYVKTTANLDLRKSKKIVENLMKNINYYDEGSSERLNENNQEVVYSSSSAINKKTGKGKLFMIVILLIALGYYLQKIF